MTKTRDLYRNLEALTELRRRICDVLPEFKNDFRRHDASLIKFLRARDYNVEQTEEMIRKHLEWRRINKIDEILKRPVCEELYSCVTYYLTGFDKFGHPVILAPMGRWDPVGALHPDLATEAPMMLIQFCEQIMELLREISTENSMITSYFPILDLGSFDYRLLAHTEAVSRGLTLLRDGVQILLNNYPEAMHQIVIVNAPAIFQMAWSVVKPMLTARSLSRIHIFGGSKDTWKKALLEHIDPDCLPSQYGGANTSCLIANKFTIDHGLIDIPQLEILPEDLISHQLDPGKTFTVEVSADAGERIVWNFRTEEFDIGFRLETIDGQSIIENCRVDSHKFLQKGVFPCKRKGKYKLIFDNSFSYRTAKQLKYAVARRRYSGPCNVS